MAVVCLSVCPVPDREWKGVGNGKLTVSKATTRVTVTQWGRKVKGSCNQWRREGFADRGKGPWCRPSSRQHPSSVHWINIKEM